jgi:DNA-binding transcriptional LysR family regulator
MVNLGRFDLVSLRVFSAVVETGSLTAGAMRFGISLAAASKRMVELERDLGAPLLTRAKKGATPTPAGQTLYRHVQRLIGDLESMALAMNDYGHGVESHVRLWVNTSAVNGFLPGALKAYIAAHPATKIDLEEALSDAVVRAVASGAADLGIFSDNIPAAGLETVACDTDQLVLLLPRKHVLATRKRVRFSEAMDYDFIGLERSASLLRLLGSAADTLGRPLKVRVQVRSFDAMCHMIAMGIGIGVLPRAAAMPHVASMNLAHVQLNESWATRHLLLGWRSSGTLSKPARALAEVILGRALSGVA